MAEIKISIESLEGSIKELNSLKESCNVHKPMVPGVVGGGKAVGHMELIAEMYDSLNTDLKDLISNTIALMENAKQSYVTSDSIASSKIKGK